MWFSLDNVSCLRNHVVIGAPRSGKTCVVQKLIASFDHEYAKGGIVFDEEGAKNYGAEFTKHAVCAEFTEGVMERMMELQRAYHNYHPRPLVLDDLMYTNKHATEITRSMMTARHNNTSVIMATTYDYDERLLYHADFVYLMRPSHEYNLRRTFEIFARYFFKSYEAFLGAFRSTVKDMGDCLVIETSNGRWFKFNAVSKKAAAAADEFSIVGTVRESCEWIQHAIHYVPQDGHLHEQGGKLLCDFAK